MIRILFHDLPTVLLSVKAADTQLIGDGRIALVVGGVAGVDGNFHSKTSSLRSPVHRALAAYRNRLFEQPTSREHAPAQQAEGFGFLLMR